MDSVCGNGPASGNNLARINPETKSEEQGDCYLEVMVFPNSCIVLDNWSSPLRRLVFIWKLEATFLGGLWILKGIKVLWNWGSKEDKFFIKCWVSVAWLWAGFSWLSGQNLNFGMTVCFWVEVWADCCLHQRLWLHSGIDNWKTILVIQIQDNKFLDSGYVLSIGHMPSNGICGRFSSSLLLNRPIKPGNSCTTANLNRSPRELPSPWLLVCSASAACTGLVHCSSGSVPHLPSFSW